MNQKQCATCGATFYGEALACPTCGGGVFLSTKTRHESTPTAPCDMCGTSIIKGDGYLLTTRQVVSNPLFWEYAYSHQWRSVKEEPDSGALMGTLAQKQAAQTTPWLMCQTCAHTLGEHRDKYREYARLWWASGGEFAPPGSGPVSPSVVRVSRSRPHVARATKLYVFGRGFCPTDDQEIAFAISSLLTVHGAILRDFHVIGSPVESTNEPTEDVLEFVRRSSMKVDNNHPHAYMLDAILRDTKSGKDMFIKAVWDGLDAKLATRQFAKPRAKQWWQFWK